MLVRGNGATQSAEGRTTGKMVEKVGCGKKGLGLAAPLAPAPCISAVPPAP